MSLQSPCHNCTKRTNTCHHSGNCEEWAEYQEKVKADREKRREECEVKMAIVGGIIQRKRRARNAKK